MKKMVCEICGSQSIRKENGIFVCQECGTEYSVVDAKKLLVDVDEQSSGSNQINETTKTDNDTGVYLNENTDINGKNELIFKLFLWANNLEKLQSIDFWFDSPVSTLTEADFWENQTIIKDADAESSFPTLTTIINNYHPLKIEYGIKRNLSYEQQFNSNLRVQEGYKKLIHKLESYGNELTNSSVNLYKNTATKYFVILNNGTVPLKDLIEEIQNYPSSFIKKKLDVANVVYSEYSKFWGTKKQISAVNVGSALKEMTQKCKDSEKAFVEENNQVLAVYKEFFPKIKELYLETINNCKELEKQLFLPFKYRDLGIVMELIDMVRSGKATNWKDLINLYDTQVFREKITFELRTINENLANINDTLIKGFTMINNHLLSISNSVKSIDEKLSNIQSDINKNLSSIKRNTFITMWSVI